MYFEQLQLMLCDAYQMDIYYPPLLGKWNEEYKEASYSRWAVDELIEYISRHIYPRKSASIKEYKQWTSEFMWLMGTYSKVNPNTKDIFRTAEDTASDVLDLLHCME